MRAKQSWACGIAVVGITAALANQSAHAQDVRDVWLGSAGGKVGASTDGLVPGTGYFELIPNQVFGGYSNNDPGFDHVRETRGGVGPLPQGVELFLRVVELDPALIVVDLNFEIAEFPGDEAEIGDENVHTHLTWAVDEFVPGFDPDDCAWEGRLRVIDKSGSLQPSDTMRFLFSNVTPRARLASGKLVPATGDADGDADVGKRDQDAFSVCIEFGGPDVRPSPAVPEVTTCEVDCHNWFDFDDDIDIDLRDMQQLQLAGSS